MTSPVEQLGQNLRLVREQIQQAAERARRDPAEITLVAVTKYAPEHAIPLLGPLGVCDLGEARPQQLAQRRSLAPESRWHLIGHLQRNKVRVLLPHAALIHSVDSLRLLLRIGEIAGELSLQPRVLLEVNVSGEAQKDGFSVDQLREQWDELASVSNVRIAGLMAMAPLLDNPADARPCFQRLRQLRDELQATPAAAERNVRLSELSMGMSGDFEVAIEEGATLVRIGSAIFEGI